MLKGRRTRIIIIIITGLLILSVSNIFLFKLKEELDKQENYSKFNSPNQLNVIIAPSDSITCISDEEFDSFNLDCSIFNNLNLDINQKTTISLTIIIGTSAGVQLLGLLKNKQHKEELESGFSSTSTSLDLSIAESQVLSLVEEFLNKNRVCYKAELVSFIKNKNSQEGNWLNRNGIEQIINSLISKHIIVEGSKITRNTILFNMNRRSIYQEIKNNPGTYLNKLSKDLGFSIFLTNWHLNILLRFNVIRKQEINNQIAYFDSELPSDNDHILQIISRIKCCELIEYLNLKSKGCTKSQIGKTLRMHHTTVNKYLEILLDNQLVILKTLNKQNIYCLNNEKLAKLKYLD